MPESGEARGASAIDAKTWPSLGSRGQDYCRQEIVKMVDEITEKQPDAFSNNSKLLTHLQACQLVRMYRHAAIARKYGNKWKVIGQILEYIAALSNAAVPGLIGLQTQFDKNTQPLPFWAINITTIVLSVIATVCVTLERTRHIKNQGFVQETEAAHTLFELQTFISASRPYSENYREHFPRLSMRIAEIQQKCTSDESSMFRGFVAWESKQSSDRPSSTPSRPGTTLARTLTINKIKPILQPTLEEAGVAWEVALPILGTLAIEDLKACIDTGNVEPIISKLMSAQESSATELQLQDA